MSTTNLGRVQGAGCFYANTTSSTLVNKSSLTPSSIPALVGDTVLFSDGDVRTITATSSTTITCGNVITSLKGPQGIQGLRGPMGPSGLDAMSEAQLAAINSGITSTKVTTYDVNNDLLDELSSYVSYEVPNKLDKTNVANQIYVTDGNGNQTTFPQSSNVVNNAFVKRKNNGQIKVPATPSASDDATSKGYVDGLTTPSSWTTVTASSNILGGVCQYATIGKLVLVHMADVTIKSGTSAHEALLFSGLPTPNQDFITIAVGHSITTVPIRFHVLSNGNIILHYSDTASFGDQYAHHYADFCYIKS